MERLRRWLHSGREKKDAPREPISPEAPPTKPPKPDKWPKHVVGPDGTCYWDFGATNQDWWAFCSDDGNGPHRFSKRGPQFRKDRTIEKDGRLPWEP